MKKILVCTLLFITVCALFCGAVSAFSIVSDASVTPNGSLQKIDSVKADIIIGVPGSSSLSVGLSTPLNKAV